MEIKYTIEFSSGMGKSLDLALIRNPVARETQKTCSFGAPSVEAGPTGKTNVKIEAKTLDNYYVVILMVDSMRFILSHINLI